MAVRSHSRFTDEIYCTPAPQAPEIQSKKIDEIRDEIFPQNNYPDFRAGLHAAEELKSKDLYEKYSPKFKDKNKRYIVDLLNAKQQYVPSPGKSILITRWKPFVPTIEANGSSTKIIFKNDAFDYLPNPDSEVVEWYLNFANSDLFAYYGGPLLAQDELQVLECIELAALREYFVQTVNTVGSRTVGSDAQGNKPVPTPILISNTERVINLDTKDIYGNAFAKADENQLKKAFSQVTPSQPVNLIAIEAPSYGAGAYTYDQISYILTTCYTGFKAAQILANKTRAMNTGLSTPNQRRPSRNSTNNFRTVIHTGWWGCGAYGNNRQMMLITQMLAATWAQVDRIVFHTQNAEHQKDIEKAQEAVERWRHEKQAKEVIDGIVKLNLEWDKSNDT